MQDAGNCGRPEGEPLKTLERVVVRVSSGPGFLLSCFENALFFGIVGLDRDLKPGKLDGLPRSMACEGCVMVGVRFLRTQQRVKSQCLIGFRSRSEAAPAWFFGTG